MRFLPFVILLGAGDHDGGAARLLYSVKVEESDPTNSCLIVSNREMSFTFWRQPLQITEYEMMNKFLLGALFLKISELHHQGE